MYGLPINFNVEVSIRLNAYGTVQEWLTIIFCVIRCKLYVSIVVSSEGFYFLGFDFDLGVIHVSVPVAKDSTSILHIPH